MDLRPVPRDAPPPSRSTVCFVRQFEQRSQLGIAGCRPVYGCCKGCGFGAKSGKPRAQRVNAALPKRRQPGLSLAAARAAWSLGGCWGGCWAWPVGSNAVSQDEVRSVGRGWPLFAASVLGQLERFHRKVVAWDRLGIVRRVARLRFGAELSYRNCVFWTLRR